MTIIICRPSLPSRERGLKLSRTAVSAARIRLSLPSRERGLKCCTYLKKKIKLGVAPFAGAWIEMKFHLYDFATYCVAPFAGAWIEILDGDIIASKSLSRSLRGSVD